MLLSIVFHSVCRRSGFEWTEATRILFPSVSVHVCLVRYPQVKVLVADRTRVLASHVKVLDVFLQSPLEDIFAAMLAGHILLGTM